MKNQLRKIQLLSEEEKQRLRAEALQVAALRKKKIGKHAAYMMDAVDTKASPLVAYVGILIAFTIFLLQQKFQGGFSSETTLQPNETLSLLLLVVALDVLVVSSISLLASLYFINVRKLVSLEKDTENLSLYLHDVAKQRRWKYVIALLGAIASTVLVAGAIIAITF